MSKLPIHMETREEIGEKLISPSALRNRDPIADVLLPVLTGNARVLEIAAGTGQHAAYFCALRPDINWQPTDIDAKSRQSQNAYRRGFEAQIQPSIALDMTAQDWGRNLGRFDAIYCANMVHIAPWEAALGLAAGARQVLKPGGSLILYGPFLDGKNSAPSNLDFDRNLKSRNPAWGVRDLHSVKHIFAQNGLGFVRAVSMPRDNFFLEFTAAK